MFDPKNEAHEFTAASRKDAIDKACQFYNVESDALDIFSFAAGAVYGLSTRALIVAAPKGRTAPPRGRGSDDGESRSDREPRGRGGRDRDRGRERGGERGGRDRDRGGRDRGPRGAAGGGASGRDRDSRNRDDRPEPAAASSSEPSVGTPRGDLGDVSRFVLGVIERMKLGPFQISEGTENELTVVEVKGAAAAALGANEGRTVDALQLLANQVALLEGPDGQRVVIDIEGNADAREEFLAKLADRVATRALQSGRPIALDPMNGRDRRFIHIALRDRDDVATMSEGEGRYRQVVVVPEGADEFEEAARQSKGSEES